MAVLISVKSGLLRAFNNVIKWFSEDFRNGLATLQRLILIHFESSLRGSICLHRNFLNK